MVLPRHGHYVFETSNGRIALEMPHDTAGKFDIKTSNGLVEFRLVKRPLQTRSICIFVVEMSLPLGL